MKKLMLVMVGMMFYVPAYATTMCAINDSVAVVLDPSIYGTNSGYDASTGTWWTQFPYGRIYGTSACIDTSHGKGGGGAVSKLTDSNGNRVKGSEKNGDYCWCKITHPVSSLWAFRTDLGSAGNCATYCAYYCGNYVQNNGALRAGLFGSVVQ